MIRTSLKRELVEVLERLYYEWQVLACQCIGGEENEGHKNCIVSDGLPWVESVIKRAGGQL